MSRDLAVDVEKLFASTTSYVQKKAALCAVRIIRKARPGHKANPTPNPTPCTRIPNPETLNSAPSASSCKARSGPPPRLPQSIHLGSRRRCIAPLPPDSPRLQPLPLLPAALASGDRCHRP